MAETDLSCFVANQDLARRTSYPDEQEHPFRGKFQRDRDRILYSRSFQKLGGKTQVFVAGYDDLARNRLTHTLEVVQIAKTISESLGLNIALTEAIALAHDLGHTPFGHAGERVLNFIMNGCIEIKDFNRQTEVRQRGFKHNWQGVRIATQLEQYDTKYNGLNLTDYTLWGLLHHTRTEWRDCDKRTTINDEVHCGLTHQSKKNCSSTSLSLGFYDQYKDLFNSSSFTVEGLVVAWADEIAQRHHDLADGMASGLIERKECLWRFTKIFKAQLSASEVAIVDKLSDKRWHKDWTNSEDYFTNQLSRLMINLLVTRLLSNTRKALITIKKKFKLCSCIDFNDRKNDIFEKTRSGSNIVSFSAAFLSCNEQFKEYLKKRVLNSFTAQSMDGKAQYIIKQLFKAYTTNPQQLPDKTVRLLLMNYYMNIKNDSKAKSVLTSHGIGYWRSKLETIQCHPIALISRLWALSFPRI